MNKDHSTLIKKTPVTTSFHEKKMRSNGTAGWERKIGHRPHSTARSQHQRRFSSSVCSRGFQFMMCWLALRASPAAKRKRRDLLTLPHGHGNAPQRTLSDTPDLGVPSTPSLKSKFPVS